MLKSVTYVTNKFTLILKTELVRAVATGCEFVNFRLRQYKERQILGQV